MNILKTILDFILSLGHLFFRSKKGKRQFCKKCGALVGRNGSCGSCTGTDGSGPGSCRGDHGGSAGTEEEPPGEAAEEEAAGSEEMTQRLIGWALIGVAVWKMVDWG